MSKGGSDLQFDMYQTFVNVDLQNSIQLHRVPNVDAKSMYHIDYIDEKNVNIAWTQQSYDFIESLNLANQADQFDAIIFVSEWQKQKYIEKLNCTADNLHVIENGIVPIEKHSKPKDIINLVYMSTPYRGLDVLLQAFQLIQDKNIHLHVFSSMNIYGQGSEDIKYQHLYDFCKEHPKITYNSSVSHDVMIEFLKDMHILAYPSTFEETSCISVLESMSAELCVICPELGALKETSCGYAKTYKYVEDKLLHVKVFAELLSEEIARYAQANHAHQKSFFDKKHNWNSSISAKWELLLKDCIKNKQQKTNIIYC